MLACLSWVPEARAEANQGRLAGSFAGGEVGHADWVHARTMTNCGPSGLLASSAAVPRRAIVHTLGPGRLGRPWPGLGGRCRGPESYYWDYFCEAGAGWRGT